MTESITQYTNNHIRQLYENEIDLHMVLKIIKYSYKLIILITAFFLIMAVYYAQTRPPAYRSSAMIEVKNANMSNAFGGSMAFRWGRASSADVETALLQSPYIMSDVARQLNFDISVAPKSVGYFSRNKSGAHTVEIMTLDVPNELLEKSLTLKILSDHRYTLSTQNGEKILSGVVGQLASSSYLSRPIDIRVSHIDAKPGSEFTVIKIPSVAVAGALSGGLLINEEGENTGVLQLSYTASSPERAQKILHTILETSLKKDEEQKSEEAGRVLQFLSHQLPKLKTDMNSAAMTLNEYGVKTGIFDVAAEEQLLTSDLFSLQQTLKSLEMKKMTLLQDFTSRHPLVIAATNQEDQLRNQINEVQTELKKLPFTGQNEGNLSRDLKIQERIYANVLDNVQKMKMVKAGTVSNVRVLTKATYPVSRIPVNKKSIILGGTLLGLMISLSIVFLKYILTPVVEDPDVMERLLGLSVAAILPFSQKQMIYNKTIERGKYYANRKPFILSNENPKDLAVEGIRSLRTAIQMLLLDAKDNVVAITGCSPSVGKSFVCTNLVMLLSHVNKRVLLIDADVRRGKLYQAFGKMKEPGLSTYLQGNASIAQIIQPIIPGKVDFIATGLFPHNPSELLSQKEFGSLVQTLKDNYDLVLIDTPPILAVTDAALVLRQSSTNLIVLGIGQDQVKEVQYAKGMLEKSGVTLSGMIFNAVTHHKYGYGYAKYSYGYGYGKYNYYYDYNNDTVRP